MTTALAIPETAQCKARFAFQWVDNLGVWDETHCTRTPGHTGPHNSTGQPAVWIWYSSMEALITDRRPGAAKGSQS